MIHPEQRLASLVVKRRHLVPPVHIEKLIREYSDVQEASFPCDGDAIVLPRPKSKPLIILDNTKSLVRQRFTLAHELGHLLIPWHVGTVACHTSLDKVFTDIDYGVAEAEANRFASELLIPQHWVRQVVESSKGLKAAFRDVMKAKVSPAATSLALIQVLKPGYVFATEGSTGLVTLSGRSPKTLVMPPPRGKRLQLEDYSRFHNQYALIDGVHWWQFDSEVEIELPDDGRTASLMLHDIFHSLQIRGATEVRMTQSINGIIGAANNTSKSSSPSELLAILMQRFVGRAELRRVISHSDFQSFVACRVDEIRGRMSKRSNSTPKRRRK